MYDVIWECEHKNIDGLILLMEFQKAFDSLSLNFINETLTKFNFGEKKKKWIGLFQQNSNSKIILNGHLSDSFLLYRGVRQGDPISPYLFILCTEFLTLAINNNDNIQGITIHNNEHKASQYADDTSAFFRATEENLRECLNTLTWFYNKSGLKINFSKTKIIKIGPIRETDRCFCRENNLDWVSSFTALGIVYDVKNLKNITKNNIENKIETMKKLIQAWTFRNLTPIGRITVAKSLILSKIIHVLQALRTPPLEYLKQIETMLVNFIWRNKRHEISKKILCQKYEMGGQNMVNIVEFDLSLKLTWIRKLLNGDNEWEEIAKENKIDRLPLTGENQHIDILKSIQNPFWKIKWYESLRKKNTIEIGNECLWGNPLINIPYNNTLFKANLIYVNDLYNEQAIPLNI